MLTSRTAPRRSVARPRLPYGKVVDWWGFGTLLYEMMTGKTPFFGRNRKRMFHNILHRDVVFTRLGSGPSGVQEIMDHPFFASIDFDKLLKREVEPPFKPVVNSEADTGNVDNIFTREMARDSPVTQALGATHLAQAHFDGLHVHAWERASQLRTRTRRGKNRPQSAEQAPWSTQK
ncbi:hypothetical protein PsorP6_016932 [Peronosclerospora sorghi]|uniref:Uncharacterized protein n=1 Tax=Peronosclerospora sorghi TaxID=230839 RepID=A0ACC0WF07_9STRA|nr:hypothetical protein PsorP6_016932 [Peronosclerospora sorghi]